MFYCIDLHIALEQNGIFNKNTIDKYYRCTIRHFVVDKALCTLEVKWIYPQISGCWRCIISE